MIDGIDIYIYSCCWFNIHIYFLKTFLHVYIDKICKPGQCIPKTDTITTTFTFYFYFWLKNVKSVSSSFVESESKTEFQFPRDERKRHGNQLFEAIYYFRRNSSGGRVGWLIGDCDRLWKVSLVTSWSFFLSRLYLFFILCK